MLRLEDLDGPRTVPAAVTGNLEELRWLGLDWDEGPDRGGPFAPYVQSERSERYASALRFLTLKGLTFECWLSRRDLRELASAPHGELPAYGPTERRLNEQLREQKQEQGKQPSIRLKGPEAAAGAELSFNDLLQGQRRFDARTGVGDIILRRADGMWAYQLAVVVDDMLMGIREVVRGSDLLRSTAAQLVIWHALESPAPNFLHVPLLLDQDGNRLAKRHGSLTLAGLIAQDTEPARVTGLLAFSLGLLKEPAELTPRELLEGLPADWLQLLARDPARLTERQLSWLRNS